MLKYVLVFVNFMRNVRPSDQVFRIGSKKTARQVEAIIERDHPFVGGYLYCHNHHYHYDYYYFHYYHRYYH